jgi:DNA-binding NarL/FixJ family response regulator
MTVVGEAATVTEALKIYEGQEPQVVVTDLQLPDGTGLDVIRAARHAAVSPRSFVCTGLVGAMMRRSAAESTRLSDREHEVLLLLADGLGAAAIGEKLYLSESTAKSHIARIYQKLGASNRAQALVTAMRIGLLSSVRPVDN